MAALRAGKQPRPRQKNKRLGVENFPVSPLNYTGHTSNVLVRLTFIAALYFISAPFCSRPSSMGQTSRITLRPCIRSPSPVTRAQKRTQRAGKRIGRTRELVRKIFCFSYSFRAGNFVRQTHLAVPRRQTNEKESKVVTFSQLSG